MFRHRLGAAPLVGALAAAACVAVAAAHAAGRPDLHTVDWNRATLPGSVCGADRPIVLHTGSATVRSHRWPAFARVSVDRGRVVYGDLNGDGRDEAALQVVCANLGGTAAGQLGFAVVVYTPGARAPRVVGVLTPTIRTPGRHVPILVPTSITRDEVTVTEYVYGPRDGDCCPSGRARAVWRLKDGALRPASTRLQKQPSA